MLNILGGKKRRSRKGPMKSDATHDLKGFPKRVEALNLSALTARLRKTRGIRAFLALGFRSGVRQQGPETSVRKHGAN